MNHLQPPQIFEPGASPFDNWSRWSERYLNYAIASGAANKSVAEQRALLLHVIGDVGYAIYETFTFMETGDVKTVSVILNKFAEHYKPYANEIFRAHQFHTCYQQPAQSVDDYVGELKHKIKDCGYASLQDRLVRDKLVSGIRDKALQERLLRESELTLPSAIAMCRAAETSKLQTKAMATEGEVSVNKVYARPPPTASRRGNLPVTRQTSGGTKPVTQSSTCRNCPYEHPPRQCPAFAKECLYCHKKGHFISKCEVKFKRAATIQDQTDDHTVFTSLDDLCINTVRVNQITTQKSIWSQVVHIRGQPVVFRLDTGADVNILPITTIRRHKWSFNGMSSNIQLSNYVPTLIPVIGQIKIQCVINQYPVTLLFCVTDTDTEPILGGPTCVALSLVTRSAVVHHVSSSQLVDKIMSQYSDVFTGMGKLCKEYHIHVKSEASPTVIYPRRIPSAMETPVKKELQWLLDNDIIAPVTQPTSWVNPIVIVPKKDGTVRICMDPVHLNQAIIRKMHYLPSVEEMFQKIKGKKIFTLLDGKKGFYMIPLDEQSSQLCTFATPYGLYRFKRLPFGVKCGPEIFQEAMEEVFVNVDGADPFQDDILICGVDEDDHAEQLRATLEAARQANMKLNVDKSKVGLTELKYLGHIISSKGIRPDPDKVTAINEMPPPLNKTELLRFLGMLNYLSRYISDYATIAKPLRDLLKKDAAWVWDPNREEAFRRLQHAISSAPTLQVFDNKIPIVVQTDASSYGLGGCLMQNDMPVAYTSTSLTKAQQGYSQIEKELLAVLHAVDNWSFYTYGRPVQVQTDHKPLIGLFNKSYEQTTPRLQKMRLKLQRYDVRLNYVPGKDIPVADTLSRAPSGKAKAPDIPVRISTIRETVLSCISDARLDAIRSSTKADPITLKLLTFVRDGWPTNANDIPHHLQQYVQFQDELHVVGEIVCRGQRIVIPQSQRQLVLQALHEAHRGIGATIARARQHVYWPNMTSDIVKMINNCDQCARFQRNQSAQPVHNKEAAQYPWQQVAVDFFVFNSTTYILCVDGYSNFIVVLPMRTTTATFVIEALQQLFSMFGQPQQVNTDNGPPFSSAQFTTFLTTSGISWSSSSPHFPRSNGLVERMVQTVKNMFKKASADMSVQQLVLQYNATPVSHGWTPSERFLSRHLRTSLPSIRHAEQPSLSAHHMPKANLSQSQERSINAHKHTLPPLPAKAAVWFKLQPSDVQWHRGSLIQRSCHPDSFIIQTPSGSLYRRNRSHIRLYKGEDKTNNAEQYFISKPQQEAPNTEVPTNLEVPKTQESLMEHNTVQEGRRTRTGRQTKVPSYLKDFELY